MKKDMSDPWIDHLQQHHLIDIHEMAESVGYRVRVANDWFFDIEYVSNPSYIPSPTDTIPVAATGKSCAVLTFENSKQGKLAAIRFFQSIPTIRSFLTATEDAFRRSPEDHEQNEEWDMYM